MQQRQQNDSSSDTDEDEDDIVAREEASRRTTNLTVYTRAERQLKIARFAMKKQKTSYNTRRIIYTSRKEFADSRPREGERNRMLMLMGCDIDVISCHVT